MLNCIKLYERLFPEKFNPGRAGAGYTMLYYAMLGISGRYWAFKGAKKDIARLLKVF